MLVTSPDEKPTAFRHSLGHSGSIRPYEAVHLVAVTKPRGKSGEMAGRDYLAKAKARCF